MDQVIVYPHQTLEGEIVVIYPNMNCGLTVEQIALKDVPPSVPYIIMNKADVPTGADAMYLAAWEADFSQPHGAGANYGYGSYYAISGWTSDNTPILRKEEQIQ